VPPGRAFALIQIPAIDVERVVVEGVGRDDLRKGPGHVPSTMMPGQPGTFGVSGHRTTYGAPFYRLDELRRATAS
jgi:sortase A